MCTNPCKSIINFAHLCVYKSMQNGYHFSCKSKVKRFGGCCWRVIAKLELFRVSDKNLSLADSCRVVYWWNDVTNHRHAVGRVWRVAEQVGQHDGVHELGQRLWCNWLHRKEKSESMQQIMWRASRANFRQIGCANFKHSESSMWLVMWQNLDWPWQERPPSMR